MTTYNVNIQCLVNVNNVTVHVSVYLFYFYLTLDKQGCLISYLQILILS